MRQAMWPREPKTSLNEAAPLHSLRIKTASSLIAPSPPERGGGASNTASSFAAMLSFAAMDHMGDGSYEGADALAGIEERVQKLLRQLLGLVAARIGAHADRCDDRARGRFDRNGDHAQPELDLLVVDCIARFSDSMDFVPYFLVGRLGLRR